MATDVRIGGRLETVAPRPVTDQGDRARLAVLVLVAVALHVWLIVHTHVTARDSTGFAQIALRLENPKAAGYPDLPAVLKDAQHPPGYPVTVLAVSWVVRAVYQPAVPDPLPYQMLLSAQVASSLAAVLLVVPTYLLGRMLFGRFAGFAAALLFQVLPVPAHDTADGLTEGLYMLGLGAALLLGARAVKKPGVGGFLSCGLAVGMTYLVRPEGLLAAAAVVLVSLGMAVTKRWHWSLTAARLAALGVGAALPAVPYMVMIGGVTNKPTGIKVFERVWNARTAVTGVAPPPAVFAAWYVPGEDDPKALWVAEALAKETTKTFHYAPLGLAALGLWLTARRFRAEPWLWVPALYGVLTVGMLVAVAWVRGYLSERHTVPLVYVGCLFAAAGLEGFPRVMGRFAFPAAPAVGLALIVVSCLPVAMKPLHPTRAGHKAAGEILRDRAAESDTVIDPYDWAQYYAGRTVRSVRPDPPPVAGTHRWAVLERGEKPDSALPRLQAAIDVASDTKNKAEVVGHWPADGPVERAKVILYKQRITAEEEAAWRAQQVGRTTP